MKSRYQVRTLTITSVLVLVMMLLGQLSLPFTAFAEGGNIEPPLNPYPIDTLDTVTPDTTSTSTALSETTDPSLLDAIIAALDVIL